MPVLSLAIKSFVSVVVVLTASSAFAAKSVKDESCVAFLKGESVTKITGLLRTSLLAAAEKYNDFDVAISWGRQSPPPFMSLMTKTYEAIPGSLPKVPKPEGRQDRSFAVAMTGSLKTPSADPYEFEWANQLFRVVLDDSKPGAPSYFVSAMIDPDKAGPRTELLLLTALATVPYAEAMQILVNVEKEEHPEIFNKIKTSLSDGQRLGELAQELAPPGILDFLKAPLFKDQVIRMRMFKGENIVRNIEDADAVMFYYSLELQPRPALN